MDNPPPISAKRKPKETNFSQQSYPAWEPILNFESGWKLLAAVGIVLIVMWILLLFMSSTELSVNYNDEDSCVICKNSAFVAKSKKCGNCLLPDLAPCTCNVKFHVHELKTPIYVYYELENFYQNHRRFVKSRDDHQLLGQIFDKKNKPIKPSYLCKPFAHKEENNTNSEIYFPCGAIANAMFTDIISVKKGTHLISLDKGNITWESEKNHKYKNPEGINSETYKSTMTTRENAFQKNFLKPKDWTDSIYKEWWHNGGLQNPDFINWMHPAASSKFRKLYGVIHEVPSCRKSHDKHVMCAGEYELTINYKYDVERFKGKKNIIFSTTSNLGGPNGFVIWFTFGLGSFSLFVSGLFFVKSRFFKPRRIHPSNTIPQPENTDPNVHVSERQEDGHSIDTQNSEAEVNQPVNS